MNRLATSFLLLLLFLFSASRVLAQQGEQVTLTAFETVYNGDIAIYELCEVDNLWGTDYYPSVLAWNCSLTDPNGGVPYTGNANWNASSSWIWNYYYPVSTFGNWTASSQSWISLYEDEYFADNGFYDDLDGYAYLGIQQCGSLCTLYGNGELASLYHQTEQFAGNSVSVYVSPVTVEVSPSSVSLDAGEQQTFTAYLAGIPSGGNTGVTWTLDGTSVGTGSTYAYTSPSTNVESTHTLKACSVIAPTACAAVTIVVLAEEISVETPSPQAILADGSSVSYLYADLTNTAPGTVVTWTPSCPPSPGTACSSGDTTATYTAPTASSVFTGQNASSPQLSIPIKGCIGTSTNVCATTNLTLVEPVSISTPSGLPASLAAGTTTSVTIAGAGFGTSPTVSVNNPNGGAFSGITFTPTGTPTNTQIQGSIFIPANLSNVGASQPITLTVSATTSGLTTSATSNAVSIVPIAYTYTLSLTSSSPSPLTYGEVATITPHIACKTISGAACSGSVSNPQEAVFSYTGVGSLSPSGLAASTTYTASTMLPSAQNSNVVVQGCLPAADSGGGCVTQTFSIAATTITLNPPAMSGPMTSGKTQGFSATIQNPGTANQLTWTLTPLPANAAPGTLASTTTAITGTTTSGTSGTQTVPANTYIAPNPIASAASVMLNVCMTANTSICATPVTIQLPGFSVTATNNNPSQTALSLGHSMSYAVNVSALDGFAGSVALTVSGLPAGVTASFLPASITTSGTATLTLNSSYNSPTTRIGSFPITLTGTSGSSLESTLFTLTTQPLQYRGYCGVQ